MKLSTYVLLTLLSTIVPTLHPATVTITNQSPTKAYFALYYQSGFVSKPLVRCHLIVLETGEAQTYTRNLDVFTRLEVFNYDDRQIIKVILLKDISVLTHAYINFSLNNGFITYAIIPPCTPIIDESLA